MREKNEDSIRPVKITLIIFNDMLLNQIQHGYEQMQIYAYTVTNKKVFHLTKRFVHNVIESNKIYVKLR